jgi:hypothetical protein
MFKGRTLIIATKHKKEKVIAPILEKELGVKCIVLPDLDTDQLGTFTGEIERKDDPLTTARNKCQLAMESANCDLSIANEGSFGPHPHIFFIPADDEILLLVDKKNNLEISASLLSTETNFNQAEIKTEEELWTFAHEAQFPSHGLILRKAKNDFTDVVKNITSFDQLSYVFNRLISSFGKAYIETDMRAMYNPLRMKVISHATLRLIEKIKSCCPNCNMPGFGIVSAKKGLPCQWCTSPTKSILSYVYQCQRCTFSKEEKYPHGKIAEDPMYCDVCNP